MRFAGKWSGEEQLSESPWGPGGPARGRCEIRERPRRHGARAGLQRREGRQDRVPRPRRLHDRSRQRRRALVVVRQHGLSARSAGARTSGTAISCCSRRRRRAAKRATSSIRRRSRTTSASKTAFRVSRISPCSCTATTCASADALATRVAGNVVSLAAEQAAKMPARETGTLSAAARRRTRGTAPAGSETRADA